MTRVTLTARPTSELKLKAFLDLEENLVEGEIWLFSVRSGIRLNWCVEIVKLQDLWLVRGNYLLTRKM